MALAEGAARCVLTRKADRIAFGQQGSECQGFGCGPIEPFAAFKHF